MKKYIISRQVSEDELGGEITVTHCFEAEKNSINQ
jgi:hypothetical protein